MKRNLWKAFSWMAAAGAALAGRKAASSLWDRMSDTESPVNPADRSVGWSEAAGWAAIAGVTAGLARVLGRRGAVAAWEKATGEAPPTVTTV